MGHVSEIQTTCLIFQLCELESMQCRWSKQIEDLQDLSYWERLSILNLYSMQGKLFRADLSHYWKIFNGICYLNLKDIFSISHSVHIWGHMYKVAHKDINWWQKKVFYCLLHRHLEKAASGSCNMETCEKESTWQCPFQVSGISLTYYPHCRLNMYTSSPCFLVGFFYINRWFNPLYEGTFGTVHEE